MYFLLIVIIVLLSYIAFFTPERRREREIRRVQKIFNTPISHELFDVDDPRNKTNPDDFVLYEGNVMSRNFALISYESKKNELKDKVENEKRSSVGPKKGDYVIMDGSHKDGRRYCFRAIRCYRYLHLNSHASEGELIKAYDQLKKDKSQTDLINIGVAYEFILDFLKMYSTLSGAAKKDFHDFFRMHDLFLKSKTEQERKDFEKIDEEVQIKLFDLEVGAHSKKYKL